MKKNNRFWFLPIISIGLLIMLTNGCTPEDTLPDVATNNVYNITQTSAIIGGLVFSDGGDGVTSRGIYWNTIRGLMTEDGKVNCGSGTGNFSSTITNLSPNTTYYVQAFARNKIGMAVGEIKSFTTLPAGGGSVSDIDGNVYDTVVIGTQTWLVQNLKVTKLNDGTSIPLVTSDTTWLNQTTAAYCWYNNNEALVKDPFGALYNWYAVNTGKLCPAGWHVPDDVEWDTLITFLGGNPIAGGKLKDTGTIYWLPPNTGASNESGFTALPGGCRSENNGLFDLMFESGWYWSSKEESITDAWSWELTSDEIDINAVISRKKKGISVRCIRD
ncbi:fibrobacter succinogenes major paralogous domain-containing protein [candidate division KSB1 bacterium]